MSKVFFEDLELSAPDVCLNVGSGTHTEQTTRVMMAFEPYVAELRPDWVIVMVDVNSTLACVLVCSKLSVKVAHVEASLRSGDKTMPEKKSITTPKRGGLMVTLKGSIHFCHILLCSMVLSLCS